MPKIFNSVSSLNTAGIIKKYKCTIILLFAGILFYVLKSILNLSVTENIISIFNFVNDLKIERILFPVFLILIGLLVDVHRAESRRKQKIILENNSYSIFKATMESLNDIMSNYIQLVQHYRLEVSCNTELEKELDELTETTIMKLRDLGLIEKITKDQLSDQLAVLKIKGSRQN